MSDKPLGDPLAGPTYKGFATTPERPRAPVLPARRRARLAGVGAAAAVVAGLAGLTVHHPGASPEPAPPRRPPAIAAAPPLVPRPVQAVAPTPPAAAALGPPPTTEALDVAPPAAPVPSPKAGLRPRPARDRCAAQNPPIARILCQDPQVASLDRQVNAAFAAAMRGSAAPGELANDQESWILRRDRAAREAPDAVADLYRERIAVLAAEGGQQP